MIECWFCAGRPYGGRVYEGVWPHPDVYVCPSCQEEIARVWDETDRFFRRAKISGILRWAKR